MTARIAGIVGSPLGADLDTVWQRINHDTPEIKTVVNAGPEGFIAPFQFRQTRRLAGS
jgi:hypothetical protein